MNVVFAVHGVGPTNPGEIKSSIREMLEKRGIQTTVDEYHWADLQETTEGGEALTSSLIWEILFNPISSSFIETRSEGRSQLWQNLAISVILAEVARTIVLIPFIVLPVCLPIIAGLFWFFEAEINAVSFCVLAALSIAKVGFGILLVAFAMDILWSFWRKNPNILFASARRNLLHLSLIHISEPTRPY